MSLVIALLGPAGSGKSTVSKHLVEQYGAVRYSLARDLKLIAQRTLGFSDEQLYGTQEQKEAIDPRYGFSCRWFLQKLGTDGVRTTLGDDFWTKICLDQIAHDGVGLAVIDDARFINEARLIRSSPWLRGVVWRLNPPNDFETHARAHAAGSHASETEWAEAEVDSEIWPAKRGVADLLALVDTCAKKVLT